MITSSQRPLLVPPKLIFVQMLLCKMITCLTRPTTKFEHFQINKSLSKTTIFFLLFLQSVETSITQSTQFRQRLRTVEIVGHVKFPERKHLLSPHLAVKWMDKTYVTNDLDIMNNPMGWPSVNLFPLKIKTLLLK